MEEIQPDSIRQPSRRTKANIDSEKDPGLGQQKIKQSNPINQDRNSSQRAKLERLSVASWRSAKQSLHGPLTPGITMPVTERHDITKAPFLAWKTRGSRKHQNHDAAKESSTLVRMLSRINESLCSNDARPGTGTVYLRGFKCTKDDLLKRHPFLATKDSQKDESAGKTAMTSASGPKSENTSQTEGRNTSRQVPVSQPPPAATLQEPSVSQDANTTGQPLQPISQMRLDDLMTLKSMELFDICQGILSQFLPDDGYAPYHIVCERFWGAVDGIIRVRLRAHHHIHDIIL
jgi:hypothetical protein